MNNKDYKVTNIYDSFSPDLVGRQDKIHPVLGKNSGKSSIKLMAEQYGIEMTDEQVLKVMEMVKNEAYVTKSGVSDSMFLKFVKDVKA